MTADAPSNQRVKRSRKRLIMVLACALAIALAVLFLKAPASEPISFKFVQATNYFGEDMLVFHGTNGTAADIWYHVFIVTNLAMPPQPWSLPSRYKYQTSGQAIPGESFTIYLIKPPKEPSWRVVWTLRQRGVTPTRWERLRGRCAAFLRSQGMKALAVRVAPSPALHYLPAIDLKE